MARGAGKSDPRCAHTQPRNSRLWKSAHCGIIVNELERQNLRELPILQRLLEQARRRVVTQLVAEKAVVALIVLLGGAVVLLLAGTQILDWYWIALLAAVSLGTGIYQLRNRIPGLYQVAQRIDRKLGLADALSTAFHFAVNPDPLRESIAERQARDANESARGVDPGAAVPYTRPKYLAVAAGLLVAAMGLFAVRYLVTGSLSLEPSLVRIALDSFFGGHNQLAKNQAKPLGIRPEPFDPGASDSTAKGDEQKDDDAANPGDQPDNAATDAQADAQQGQDSDQQGKEGANSDQNKEGGQNKQSDQNSKQGQDSKDGKQQDNNQSAKQGGQNNQSSMLDKLRDALANMMKGNKSNESQQQGKQNGQQNQQQDQSQDASAQGESQGEQQQSQSSGSQKTGEGKQDQNGADSKSDQRAGEKASQDAKNGIGSADGDKKAKEAAMLEAMGKIEELLGKRQQNITGEMIEVQSTKQQLKTPFLQLQGEHGEAGGEIHRDEVPPMYQQFVEQYFEEIRKPQAGTAPAKPTGRPTAPPAGPSAAPPARP